MDASKSAASSLPPCSICRTAQSAYCCPRCSIRTCSLRCCLEHKSRTGCNGKRDRAAFCSLARFTDAQLASDFHFLEDVLKCGERAGRFLGEEMGGHTGGGGGRRGRGEPSGAGRQNEQRHSKNGSMDEDGGAPISPLLRLSMKAAKENEKGSAHQNAEEASPFEAAASEPPASKLDEREEGEVEEMKQSSAAASEQDANVAPMAKRQRLGDDVTGSTDKNATLDSNLLNICQPASSSAPNEGDGTGNQQMPNPIAIAASTASSSVVSKVKVADPEWLARYPPHMRRLVRAAADRNTTLLLMPGGMARRKENTTTHSPKQDVIRWRVELRFHLQTPSSSPGCGDAMGGTSDGSPCSVVTIFVDGIPESNKLSDILSAQLDVNPEGKNREARSKLRSMASMTRKSLRILIKVLPCPASRPVYTEIGSGSSIADALRGLTVVEYPVFEIVKEADLAHFPRKIEELAGAD